MRKTIAKVGNKFGRITITKNYMIKRQNGVNRTHIDGICECGKNIIKMRFDGLKDGYSKSCGCLQIEMLTTHGMYKTRRYRIYQGIKTRCYNKNNNFYKDYGGRGITICYEWKNNFMSFYEWSIKNGYKEDLTIDRINNDGNYEPENCRWVTMWEQNNNRRDNTPQPKIGDKFGKLTVISEPFLCTMNNGKVKRSFVHCWCDCGISKKIKTNSLKEGNSRSCGCSKRGIKNKSITK